MTFTIAFLRPWLSRWCGDWLYVDSPFWTAVGFLGAAIFGSRFVLQWLKTEKEKKLVVPWYFWYLSFWGSVLNCIYFLHLDKAPLILGNCFLPFVYIRNIIFVTRSGEKAHRGGRKVFAVVAILLIVAAAVSVFLSSARQRDAVEQMNAIVDAAKDYKKTQGSLDGVDVRKLMAHLRDSTEADAMAIKARLEKAHFKLTGSDAPKDPWDVAYRIYLSNSGILIRSAGKNGLFDDGSPNDHEDDLIFETRFDQ